MKKILNDCSIEQSEESEANDSEEIHSGDLRDSDYNPSDGRRNTFKRTKRV
jgi:hypothetical protein